MKKKLALKKVTLKDLSTSSVGRMAGGGATDFTCQTACETCTGCESNGGCYSQTCNSAGQCCPTAGEWTCYYSACNCATQRDQDTCLTCLGQDTCC